MKKEDNKLGTLILIAIGVIVGLVLLSSISDSKSSMTDTFTNTNESLTGVNGTYVALDGYNVLSISEVRNSTHTAQVEDTDYDLNTTNAIRIINGVNGTYYADYTYQKEDYVSNSATRSIIGIIILMAALGIMLFALKPLSWFDM